ncbi:NAD-dependent epimerase/dehydratase family protein [Agriterribacter sp.]|uniref:NAD-dependent epimerase/dehydratase family protein n=1 Tax=Agriterribacter sp. TaxID=2821509 RepID=UPI002B9F9575|nr:NAD-dependent epimerase/dehydratase family protein [Agriterribacter sp.]HRO46622.1 NAD-dependent epimerase/dehydratase family protein [Agriterribacter sp.]HRQ17282.1 NAD-dependent epimerase/dehydratase family protein [Agriterribacter sp.]
MQTILGANGQIAEELARELHSNYTTDIRLVSRTPKKVNATDELFAANLLDAGAACKAVAGSDIAYLTVGLPMNAQMWAEQFPVIMRHVIDACKKHQCKLVFFDNTYMYAKTDEPQTEESPFVPVGQKSTVRAEMTAMLLAEMNNKTIEAVICRAPEFYGPGKTKSITNSLIFDNIRQHKKLKVPLKDNTLRTLIWTPDASRAMALIGNTPDAYNQTWHLPCDDNRLTYKALINLASEVYQQQFDYTVLKIWMFKLGSLFSRQAKELQELLPRYKYDNIFISEKFKKRFPDFKCTIYQEGITRIMNEQKRK